MGLSLVLILLIVLCSTGLFFLKKLKFVETIKSEPDRFGNTERHTKFNFKPIIVIGLLIIIALFQPMNWEKIDVGHKGLLINLLGDSRGASNTDVVSGIVFYNKYTQEIQEIPLDQRHIEYDKQAVVAKGGYPCEIKPSFNYSVKEQTAPDMFTNLRSTYKRGKLEAVEQGWLANAIIGAINDVANRYPVDYLFNNREKFEAEIQLEVNKRIGKWFTVSQIKTNIQPPTSIRNSIEAKAKADADANTAEAQARVAKADAQRKIELAKGDSASTVIEAAAVAEAMRLKKAELTPIYVEYIKWMDVDSNVPRVPQTMLGSGSTTYLVK